jgi:hypothetical protein
MILARLPELEGLVEAEDFFEALGVPYVPRVLDAHRLQILKVFALALEAWLRAKPEADARERWRTIADALRESHDAFAADDAHVPSNPFAPGLVKLGRRR